MPKQPGEKPKDKHKSGFMVRLPEEARTMLDEMVGVSRRAYTKELLLALEAAYARFKAEQSRRPGSST